MANEVGNSVECQRCKGTGRRRTLGGFRRCPCTPTPVKKRGPRAATHDGECGFCERRFTVSREAQRLALHGFQRPGSGWLIGDCPGHGKLPVELSTVTLEILRDYARQTAEAAENALAGYRGGLVTELLYRVRKLDAPVWGRGEEHHEFVTIKQGDLYNSQRGIPAFDDLLALRIREAERRARLARDTETRAAKRIAEWAAREVRAL